MSFLCIQKCIQGFPETNNVVNTSGWYCGQENQQKKNHVKLGKMAAKAGEVFLVDTWDSLIADPGSTVHGLKLFLFNLLLQHLTLDGCAEGRLSRAHLVLCPYPHSSPSSPVETGLWREERLLRILEQNLGLKLDLEQVNINKRLSRASGR